ncbi:MAG: GNAT family N-acetyltransferase, partial [Pauljensenia sp.]
RDWVDTIVGLDAKQSICAVASVRVLRGIHEAATAIVSAYIHPHWRGRGVGRALLYWQDGRARQMLVETFGADSEVPASISNLVDAHMTDRRRLYIAAGFFAKRIYQVMYRDLAGGEVAPQARHGYRILPWNRVAQDQIRAIHMEAFQQAFRSPLRSLWWDDAMNHFDPRWSFVAVDAGGDVVGYAMTGRPAQRWVATGRPEAYIYLLGVAEAHRGRSVASALVGNTVAAASASGVSRIGLDVDLSGPDGAHSIYEHLGFVDESAEVYYTINQ